MWAAGYGQDAMVRYLLQAGVDPALQDDRGKNAAGIAEQLGHAGTATLVRAAQGKDVP
jgi:ankyrin repeat protein